MRKLEKFLISHKPYAVKLDSLSVDDDRWVSVDAVWFRRRAGVTYACRGTLHHYTPKDSDPPAIAEEFLALPLDGRYGGHCAATWDGTKYWGSSGQPDVIKADLALLGPILENLPEIPAGYDGWWEYDR